MSTKIQWTGKTWNPIVGCSNESPGCVNCYAKRIAWRLAHNDNPKIGSVYKGLTQRNGSINWTGEVRFLPQRLEEPFSWRNPTLVFADSMSDMFHDKVRFDWLDQIMAVMALTPHTYQVPTKRPQNMLRYFQDRETAERIRFVIRNQFLNGHEDALLWSKNTTLPLPNLWLGVSTENQEQADKRIPSLLETPAAVRFLSCEPLLGPIDLNCLHYKGLTNIDCLRGEHGLWFDGECESVNWVIVGGESGPNARKCQLDRIRSIVEQCRDAEVACFVKQLGGNVWDGGKRLRLNDRKGGDPSEWPHDLRVREFPGGGVCH